MTFAEKLTRLRLKARLTKAELAHKCGLTPTIIRYWERGQGGPSRESAAKLAAALGLDADGFAKYVYRGRNTAVRHAPARSTQDERRTGPLKRDLLKALRDLDSFALYDHFEAELGRTLTDSERKALQGSVRRLAREGACEIESVKRQTSSGIRSVMMVFRRG